MKPNLESKYYLVERLAQVERDFKNTRYEEKVKEALHCYLVQDFKKLEEILNEFPDKETMLKDLLEKLKDKPVFKTLRKISNGKLRNHWEGLKGLFSLGTHVCIELEKGNSEYHVLLRDVYEKIGSMLFSNPLEVEVKVGGGL